jgi:hypothetical protein
MTLAGAVCAAAGVILLLVAPSGTRAGWWSYRVAFGLLAASLVLALGAIVLLVAGARRGSSVLTGTGIAVSVLVLAVPARFLLSAIGTPPIHDISTDLTDPPTVEALVTRRGPGTNPVRPADAARIERQQRAYPDIQPLLLARPVSETFDRALAAAHEAGWQVVASDPVLGLIEAMDTTRWFGFTDDIGVRVRETPSGSRVDVRSVSRVGVGDAGANARRIRTYLYRIDAGA